MDISFLNKSYVKETHHAMERLINSFDFQKVYQDLLPFDLEIIAQEYDHVMTATRPWDTKTNKEREIWKKKFDDTYDEMIELFNDGPFLPQQWGVPLRGELLMTLLVYGRFYKTPDDINEYYDDMSRIQELVDRADITILDILKHYKRHIDSSNDKQLLSKPRDEKASRALFIKLLHDQHYTVGQITVIARSMLEDEHLEERTVRRLIK